MRACFLMGRMLFGGFFAWSGINHFRELDQMSGYAAAKGVPKPDAAVRASGALIVAGGTSVLSGVQPRLGLAAIVAFLVPVSLQIHRFWEIDDPAASRQEMTHFMKNMALVGAALMLMRIEEPWPARLSDLRIGGEEEMYVRLGGRDLRALPA
jgi:putative oxidoreductase